MYMGPVRGLLYGRCVAGVEGAAGVWFIGCTDTSDPGHFGPETFRHHQTGAEVSRQIGTSAEVSLGHFGTNTELSQYILTTHTYSSIAMSTRTLPTPTEVIQPRHLGFRVWNYMSGSVRSAPRVIHVLT